MLKKQGALLNVRELESIQDDLTEFIEEFRPFLGRKERCHWCGIYLSGLILDGDRKSIEPMARRLGGYGNVQAMQQFINQSPWPFEPIQVHLAKILVKRFGLTRKTQSKRLPGALILDDTTFLKQGSHSVGVAHQWSGRIGKTTNCQTLVSWGYANRNVHFPIRLQLFLPESWSLNPDRLIHAGVPGSRFGHQEKWRLGLELLDSIRNEIPHQIVLTDTGYGNNADFIHELMERKEHFIVQVSSARIFWPYGTRTISHSRRNLTDPYTGVQLKNRFVTAKNQRERPFSAKKWAKILLPRYKLWRQMALPSGDATTQKNHKVRVASIRVRMEVPHYRYSIGKEIWLMIEHHNFHPEPYSYGLHTRKSAEYFKYYISNLPRTASTATLFELAHLRGKVEQDYQQLKEELGMDHFEGRNWFGLHHHVTLCMLAFGFILLEITKFRRGLLSKKKLPSLFSLFHQFVGG